MLLANVADYYSTVFGLRHRLVKGNPLVTHIATAAYSHWIKLGVPRGRRYICHSAGVPEQEQRVQRLDGVHPIMY
ncbi:hypothetical protein kuro4_19320 [Gelria sp. Kuro-4]|nr:hypothetical protein kuro4_19320 [Gelria sp. Kuro-4]